MHLTEAFVHIVDTVRIKRWIFAIALHQVPRVAVHSSARVLKQKMEAAGSLVVAMVAHGVDHKRSWPFIALSSFQQRSSTVRGLSGALYLGFMPKVRLHLMPWARTPMHQKRDKTNPNRFPPSVLIGYSRGSRGLGELHDARW